MSFMKVLDGNSAIAEGIKQINPDVVSAYPILPSTPIIEDIASFIANGQIDTELITADSDHSAISGCIGASAAGGRVFSATASQGLSLMHEILFIASSLRLPIVIGVTNSSLSAPINIQSDHSNVLIQRDCGWIQIFSENSQEAYDNVIQSYKIAENMEVRTPVIFGIDSFITSHSLENVLIESTEEVEDYVGKFNPVYSILDNDNPKTIGSFASADYYYEHKVNQLQGIENSRKVIKEVGKEFGDRFGRYYGFFESYKLEDADFAFVLMGSSSGTAKECVDELREKGEKIGLLKLRVFRPFPCHELKEALSKMKSIAVLDRVVTPGTHGGPLFNEIRSALYDLEKRPIIFPYVYGLGGRDICKTHFESIFSDVKIGYDKGIREVDVKFVNLRG